MKEKIAELITDMLALCHTQDEIAQAILDLIAKEFPTKCIDGYVEPYMAGYNQCLKDIKHKLGVD